MWVGDWVMGLDDLGGGGTVELEIPMLGCCLCEFYARYDEGSIPLERISKV